MRKSPQCSEPSVAEILASSHLCIIALSCFFASLLLRFLDYLLLRVVASSLFRNADFASPPAAQKSHKCHSRKGSSPAQMGGNGILRRKFRGRLTLFRLSQRSLENRKKCDGQGNLPVSLFEYINFSGCLLRLDPKITL